MGIQGYMYFRPLTAFQFADSPVNIDWLIFEILILCLF